MSGRALDLVFAGLSITSSWGNGHATTYRALLRELSRAGHRVLFLERDVPWYAAHRDLRSPPFGETALYGSLDELRERFGARLRTADVVVVGSYVPEGREVGRLVQRTAAGLAAFYDIDTPVTLAALARGECEYLSPELVPGYDLYLSFTGGPVLARIERQLGSPAARALYCSGDPEVHRPAPAELRWELGYLGTYSPDRQGTLEELLCRPARALGERRFVVAGPQYPSGVAWPANVERVEHLPPPDHAAFYAAQRYTLNVTRADMIRAGFSPSVRLFEAALCGTPVISDAWPGLETLFVPGRELLVARRAADVERLLVETSEEERRELGRRARARALADHTAAHRARELVGHVREALDARARRRRNRAAGEAAR